MVTPTTLPGNISTVLANNITRTPHNPRIMPVLVATRDRETSIHQHMSGNIAFRHLPWGDSPTLTRELMLMDMPIAHRIRYLLKLTRAPKRKLGEHRTGSLSPAIRISKATSPSLNRAIKLSRVHRPSTLRAALPQDQRPKQMQGELVFRQGSRSSTGTLPRNLYCF